MSTSYLDAIRKFEGFVAQAQWDYAQHSNGYGTRALYPGEVIDRAEAERRFQAEIANARAIVERHAPTADEGTKAALTSLTFNAGDKWTRSGLGEAVRRGDLETARELFLQYTKAGGKELSGLVARRLVEATWIGDAPAAGTDAAQGLPHVRIADATSLQLAASQYRSADAPLPPSRDAVTSTDPSRAAAALPHAEADRDDAAAHSAVSQLRQLLGDTVVDRTVLGSARLDHVGDRRSGDDDEREDMRRKQQSMIDNV